MLGWRVVDEPFAQAGLLLPFIAGVCQVQMLCMCLASEEPGTLFFFFFWQGGCLVCEHL